jgi:hypothetical protein
MMCMRATVPFLLLSVLSLTLPGSLSAAQEAGSKRIVVPGRKVQGPVEHQQPPQQPAAHRRVGPRSQAPVRDDKLAIQPEQQAETGGKPGKILAPGSLVILRDSALSGQPAPFRDRVLSPNTGSQGHGIFTTHNFYAEISTDNGTTYSYVNPDTFFPHTPAAFSAGFCCDQRAAQDPSRDLIFWLLQYDPTGTTAASTNGDRLAVTHGEAGLSTNTWTSYDITPSLFGLTGKVFDFPHLQASANDLYLTTNVLNATDSSFYGALVARIPLSQLSAGSPITIDSFLTTAYGDIMAVNGAQAEGTRPGRTTMYFASVTSTTSVKVLTWPEADAAPTETSITGLPAISTATFVCTGPDGRDPCTNGKTRMQTGWITDTELGLMFASAQNGASRPYPYTRVVILDPATLTVISQPDIYSTTSAWLYPAVAVNENGHLGGTLDNLGGNTLPTVRALIRDDLSPDVVTDGWETAAVITSGSGTAGLWGEYNGAMTHEKYATTWLAAAHVQNGGHNDANAQPHNYWFGRERDTNPTFTVTLAGAGTGTVTSSPAGIDCGATCTNGFPLGTTVTLTATPGPFSTFAGWSGACTGTGSCIVLVDGAKAVTATFDVQTFDLTVSKDGTGTGTVTSSPAGIDCGATCTAAFNGGTLVTLSATPDAFMLFTGWSGACTGTGSCVVTLDAAKSVTATFDTQAFNLGVAKDGTGTGTVTSSPAGIDCGATCGAAFNGGTVVTLTATPGPFSTFDGWSGACTGTGSCVVTIDGVKSVTATFTLQTFTLTVSKDGTGTGTVTSSPAGIDCGATCSASFDGGSTVTLSAVPDAFSTFDGWSGACTGTGSCEVTMDQAQSVTATFTIQTFTLSTILSGTGTGTVTSSPAGIDCGVTCSASFDGGTMVTLTAAPAAGSTFDGWSGDCTGTGSCVVTMDQARSVTAAFTLQTFTLTVAKDGTGSGAVTSSPAGIDCGADCSETYDYNTVVTLTPSAATGSAFTGWSGDCTGTGSCVVTMDQARSVTATFTLGQFTLTVSKAGTGGGTVTSSPAGIDCGGTCSAPYDFGTVVTLTPSAVTGSTFTGWSGACTGTGSFVVTMDAAKSVTATFTLNHQLGLNFYTVAPCRLIDTRTGGGGALTSGPIRVIPVTGICGIPSDAVTVSVNVTVVSPTGNGHITIFSGNASVPATSTLNYSAGQTRANNAVLLLSTDNLGTLAAQAVLTSGEVHLLIDVNGYFKP